MINDMTVGMENLPNVFIPRIIIKPRPQGYNIEVSVGLYDHFEKQSWKNRIDNLKVKIYFCFDTSEMEALNNGTLSLFDINENKTGAFVLSPQQFPKTKNENGYDFYESFVNLGTPGVENLNVYVACFVDDFGFENPIFNKFYGPMTAEKIFFNKRINTMSNYFYYPDTNNEYGGPVHQKPNGSYMEGSAHTDAPHEEVVLVVEENYKIQFFESQETMIAPSGVPGPMDQLTNDLENAVYVPPTQTQVAPTGVPTPTAASVSTQIAPPGGYSS